MTLDPLLPRRLDPLRALATDWSVNDSVVAKATVTAYRILCTARRFNTLVRLVLAPLTVPCMMFLRFIMNNRMSPTTIIGPGLRVPYGATGSGTHPRTVIGSYFTLYPNVTIGSRGDGYPTMGNHVTVGTRARVLGGVHIGDFTEVCAGSVAIKDSAPYSRLVGVPARPVSETGVSSPWGDRPIQ